MCSWASINYKRKCNNNGVVQRQSLNYCLKLLLALAVVFSGTNLSQLLPLSVYNCASLHFPTFSSPAPTPSSLSGSESPVQRWLTRCGSPTTWWRSPRCRRYFWSTWSTWRTGTATQRFTTASPTLTSVWSDCCWTQVRQRKDRTIQSI